MTWQQRQDIDEKTIQDILFRYPQIVESHLLKRRLPVSSLEVEQCEDVCETGRIDLAFRERARNLLVLLELQLGIANKDHYDRLVSYVDVYSERFSFSSVIGVHFAEGFPRSLPRYGPPLYRVRFEASKIVQLAESLEAEEEKRLGLDCPKPAIAGFAKLSYMNGFFAFMAKRTRVTFREIMENVPNVAKNPRQIRNPAHRAKLWVRFGESFGLLERGDGGIILTELGKAYAVSSDKSLVWTVSPRQRRILIAGLSAARCTNGHKFGIFCILRAVENSEDQAIVSAESQMNSFVELCNSKSRWANCSQKSSFAWYGNYACEMGLCEHRPSPGVPLVLTPLGREILALLSKQFAAFEMERRLLLRRPSQFA
ncbi:MAG: hypothetical protein JW941_07945 [Candidatus Coatesbacteria bacterium]|nr:hypothetical protein [Candidatus Coatesbacteria bacterium]